MTTHSLVASRRWLALAVSITAAPVAGCQTHPTIAPAEARMAALGQEAPRPRPAPQFHYLAARDVQVAEQMLPAPIDDQTPAAREFEEQLTTLMQSVASSAAIAQAREDAKDDLWKLSRVLGPKFAAANCPHIASWMANAEADAELVKNELKNHFARRRPGAVPGAPVTGSPEQWAYPSGNATRAAMRACLLTSIAPEHEQALLREAWFIGHGRLVLGVHLPNDIVAGFALGQSLAEQMLKSEAMAADLQAAKAEWQALTAAPAP